MKRERLKVRRSAKARAAALVAKIERAIEQGEFVPSETYLFFDNVRGPCGCAMAAASFVSGGTEADDDYAHCKKVGLMSEQECRALESGYEYYPFQDPNDVFYVAGREL